ncbi:MAG: hypothetical protein M3Q55_06515 [Acidobacteriota bacterium]|nr:hypothetical protein [Acidobacteriota bacterium]
MSALRFIHTVDGLPAWMCVITAIVALYAVFLTWLDPSGADTALGMLCLWQMLCTSRGFAAPASAGHYDPLLVREPRWRIAIAHAVHATLAGALAWALVGATELIRGGAGALAFEPARVGAFAFVSAVSWALSLPGRRLVAGSIWLTLIFGMAATKIGLEQYAMLLQRADGSALFVHALGFAVVCPFVLLDNEFPMQAEVSGAVSVIAAAAIAAGVAFVVRRDYPLESSI